MLKYSEKAKGQMTKIVEGEKPKPTKAEQREAERAKKAAEQEQYRATLKAERQAAKDSDTELAKALDDLIRVRAETRSRKADAEKLEHAKMRRVEAIKHRAADLAYELSILEAQAGEAVREHQEAKAALDEIDEQISANLPMVWEVAMEALKVNEERWAKTQPAYRKKARDRTLKRRAMDELGR